MIAQLEQGLSELKQGEHMCLICENAVEQLATVVAFVVEGLSRKARCVYIIDEPNIEEAIVQAVETAGVDVVRERQRGALRLLTSRDAYIRDGAFVPQAMIAWIGEAETEALADGFAGLWLTGEPVWSFGPEPGCDRLIEYEALLNQLPTFSRSVILCQYRQSRFGVPCIHDVLRTHPVAILGDRVFPNPYYEPPELVLKDHAETTPELKAKRVDWWIAQLQRASSAEQERERVVDKLKQNERRLAEAQRVAHIGSWERDLRTDEVTWSDELYRLFGVQPHEIDLSYQQFLNFVVPQDAERIRELVDEAIRERRRFNFDYRITLPDGSVRMLNDRGSIILNEEGAAIRLVGTCQDVTELRQAEQELKRQKVILQTVFDHIPVMVNFVDAAGRVQMVNKHWERVLGWSLAEAQSRDILPESYPDPQDLARVREYVQHPLPGWTDFKLRVRDGRTLDTLWALIVLPDGTRIGIGQDITERKRDEKTLRQSEERLNLAVRAADLGIFEHDHQTDTVYWSPMMRAIFGWGAEDSASLQAYFGLTHPEDRERIVVAVLQSHSPKGDGLYRVEHRVVRPDGGIRAVSVWSRTLFEGDGSERRPYRTVGIVADVTEHRRAEKEIRAYSESVQALSRRLLEIQETERRHLARELHDEFGQILASITLHLHAARGLAGAAALPRMNECAALLQQAGEQVRSLALELRPTMLDTLGLEATLRWLAEQHQQRNAYEVQVIGHLSGRPPSPEIAIACFRVAQESLTNVARHAAARHVWIELSQSESLLELVVRDDGVGFEVAPTQEQAVRRGSLGLLGMRERVQIFGGRLDVESDPGRGTRIHAAFRLIETPDQPANLEG